MAPYTWRQPEFPGDGSDQAWQQPSLLVICPMADVDAAVVPLIKTLQQPIAPGVVATVFCHETMRQIFADRVRASIDKLHRQAMTHSHSQRARQMIGCLKAEVICRFVEDEFNFPPVIAEDSPIIVCEFDQSFFGGGRTSSVVTMHTFRFVHELPGLLSRERLPFASAAVWGRKLSAVYEAALKLKLDVVYINCHAVPLTGIIEYFNVKLPHVLLAHYHHFEVLVHDGHCRMIVFPAVVVWEPEEVPKTTEEVKEEVKEKSKEKSKD
ncbi:hypothetical protein KR018_012519 [Drosophila ironensis]|nr:hypothetical protein KR018_012519 [Drosophila ironensis]